MENPEELWKKAALYRRMARLITDPQAIKALLELAGQFEVLAAELGKQRASEE